MKRMRVFAGPNGSGKSTMVNQVINVGLKESGSEIINKRRHINPDSFNSDSLASMREINFSEFGLTVNEVDFKDKIQKSPHYKRSKIDINNVVIENNCFTIPNKNSYVGAILADYLRDCYIDSNERLFSFETVLSHSSKIDFFRNAKERGWEVYLYFVATEDPYINVARVKDRVDKGGHDVPLENIIDRYWRSLGNLYPALKYCRRAYIFDNSTEDMLLIAEKNLDEVLNIQVDNPPIWLYKYVISKCRILVMDS